MITPRYSFAVDAAGHIYRANEASISTHASLQTDTSGLSHDLLPAFDAESRDLIRIALAVAAADRLSPRRPAGRKGLEGQLSWPREISLSVALESPASWTPMSSRLSDLLYFLTDDEWHLLFDAGAVSPSETLPLFPERLAPDSEIILFSGGLDAACGAALRARELAETGRHLVAITAFGQSVQKSRVTSLFTHIGFPKTCRWRGLEHHLSVDSSNEDDSRRTRGFLFLAVAAAFAKRAGLTRVISSETGVGALSTPMNTAQSGAQNTRAMHPRTITGCEAIFRDAMQFEVLFEQPYFFMTKGELCRATGSDLDALARNSISCDGGGRQVSLADAHCGYCTSCLYRRASLYSAISGQDPTRYRDNFKKPAHRYPLLAFEEQSLNLRDASISWTELTAYDPLVRHAIERFTAPGASPLPTQQKLLELFRRHADEALAWFQDARPFTEAPALSQGAQGW